MGGHGRWWSSGQTRDDLTSSEGVPLPGHTDNAAGTASNRSGDPRLENGTSRFLKIVGEFKSLRHTLQDTPYTQKPSKTFLWPSVGSEPACLWPGLQNLPALHTFPDSRAPISLPVKCCFSSKAALFTEVSHPWCDNFLASSSWIRTSNKGNVLLVFPAYHSPPCACSAINSGTTRKAIKIKECFKLSSHP